MRIKSVKDNISIKVLCLSILLSILLSIANLGIAQTLSGSKNNGYFYPDDQAWQIVDVIFKNKTKRSKDAGGILTILRYRKVYFTKNYFIFPKINSGGNIVIGSCFKSNPAGIVHASPYEIFHRYTSKNVLFVPNQEYMMMSIGPDMDLKLKKSALPNEFPSLKRNFNSLFQHIINKYKIKPNCGLEGFSHTDLVAQDLTIYKKGSSEKLILKDGILDPDMHLPKADSPSSHRIDVRNKNIRDDQCNVKQINYSNTKEKLNRRILYIRIQYVGLTESRELCNRNVILLRIDSEKIYELYGIKASRHPKFPKLVPLPLTGLYIEKWQNDNMFIATVVDKGSQTKHSFRFSNILKNKIFVEKL